MNPSRRLFLMAPVASRLWSFTSSSDPLWPGSKYSLQQKTAAIEKGLRFIYSTASRKKNFKDFGPDYLWCFYTLSAVPLDPKLKQMAWKMGRERAQVWRTQNPLLPAKASANTIAELCFGGYCADSLGIRDAQMKHALKAAAAKHSAIDFLGFDPAQPIPHDLPERCRVCKRKSPRASTTCIKCSRPLTMQDPYGILLDALVTTYSGDRYGVKLGASLPEIMKLVPDMRPYRGPNGNNDAGFYSIAYAITHTIYTLNDYGLYRLNPAWLPQEFEFLKKYFNQCILENDPETLGEFLDSLKSFGLTEQDQMIQQGEEFLLSHQNANGSWGNPKDKDAYNQYHATWTAIGGLIDYDWRGERVSFPAALVNLGVRI